MIESVLILQTSQNEIVFLFENLLVLCFTLNILIFISYIMFE